MKLIAMFAAAAAMTVPLSITPCGLGAAAEARRGCCKVCKAGKACGDSCISRDKACHKGRGCACDA